MYISGGLKIRKRTFILVAIILTLLTAAVCGGACAAAEAGNEPAIRTILLWAGGARMVALVCGESDIRFEDTVNGERTCVSYLTDTNLDGMIDEKDLEVRYNLNFAVLTSGQTFSSANAMASILSDKGIPVLGERSGGGSCSVQSNSTAEGWLYTISNNIHLINKDGEDIDAGVPVSAELVTTGDDGTRDYSAFYDFDRLRECIR